VCYNTKQLSHRWNRNGSFPNKASDNALQKFDDDLKYQYVRMTCRGMTSVFTGIAVILWLWLQVPGSSSQFLEENCGIASTIQPKIIGGKPAGLGLHPWMAFLHTPIYFRCAGSLINHCSFAIESCIIEVISKLYFTGFVLTAAHCFDEGVD